MEYFTDPKIQKMVQVAQEMQKRAYCRYSNFSVGAALLTTDDEIFTGCNVENVSFGATICAERTAVVKAVSEGKTSFQAIVIAADMKNEFVGPCGICRQVLAEFGTDIEVYLVKPDMSCKMLTLKQLLPEGFTPDWVSFK